MKFPAALLILFVLTPPLQTAEAFAVFTSSSTPLSLSRYPILQRQQQRDERQNPSSTKLHLKIHDQALTDRLKEVETEWTNIKNEGLSSKVINEITTTEKSLLKGLLKELKVAERYVDKVVKESGTNAEGGGINTDEIANVARQMLQEMSEVDAIKLLGEKVDQSVETGIMLEKGLEKVTEKLASSLKDAEDVVKSVATEGVTQENKEQMVRKLETSAKNVEESRKAADSVAETAKKIAFEDEKAMDQLKDIGTKLEEAIEATESSLDASVEAASTAIGEGEVSEVMDDSIVESVEMTASEVVKELDASEAVADVVAKKVENEADAVLALGSKASESIEAIRAAESAVKESSASTDDESFKEAISGFAEKIETDEKSADQLSDAIQTDLENDEVALEVMKSADSKIETLVNAVEDAMETDKDGEGIADAVENVASKSAEVDNAISAVDAAAERCADYAVKSLNELDGSIVEEQVEEEVKSSVANVEVAKVIEQNEPVEVTTREIEDEEAAEASGKSVIDETDLEPPTEADSGVDSETIETEVKQSADSKVESIANASEDPATSNNDNIDLVTDVVAKNSEDVFATVGVQEVDFESALEQASSSTDTESLNKALAEVSNKAQFDDNAVEKLAEAGKSGLVESGGLKIKILANAVENAAAPNKYNNDVSDVVDTFASKAQEVLAAVEEIDVESTNNELTDIQSLKEVMTSLREILTEVAGDIPVDDDATKQISEAIKSGRDNLKVESLAKAVEGAMSSNTVTDEVTNAMHEVVSKTDEAMVSLSSMEAVVEKLQEISADIIVATSMFI